MEKQLKEAYENSFDKQREGRLKISLDLPIVRTNKHHYGEAARIIDMTNLVREIGSMDSWTVSTKGFFATKKFGDSEVKVGTNFRSGVLEVKLPMAANLHEAEDSVIDIWNHIARSAKDAGVAALAYGSQPLSKASEELLIKNCKNRVLASKLNDRFCYLGLVASEKVHVGVTGKEMPLVNNVLNYYSPAIISLTANSAIIKGRSVGFADYRGIVTDMVDFSGKERKKMNDSRRRIMRPVSSVEEYVDMMLDVTPMYTMREGKPVAFSGISKFREFVNRESSEVVFIDSLERVKTAPIITPEPIDFYYHERTCWTDARPRGIYGTVELNTVSMQSSVKEVMAVGALTLGLAANAKEAWEDIRRYDIEYLEVLRRDAMEKGVSLGRTGHKGVVTLESVMLDYAEKGLKLIGEDVSYLDPLRRNYDKAVSPAQRSIDCLKQEQGSISAFVDVYRIKEV